MSKRKGWYERSNAPRITTDWLKVNCRNLTGRELDLLRIIDERRLVSREHLEIIHPSYRNIERRTNVLNRSLKKLFEKHCIDKVHLESKYGEGNTPQIVALDRGGSLLLNKKRFRRRIKQNKRVISGKGYIFRELPPDYPHIHGVNELEVRTILLCEKHNFSLKKWDLESKNTKKLPKMSDFRSKNEIFSLIPDIFCIIRVENTAFISFIEYDTGSENKGYSGELPRIIDKLERYQLYKISGIWKNEQWARKTNSPFPLIMFVTEDQKRADYINKKGRSLGLYVEAFTMEAYVENLKSLLLKK